MFVHKKQETTESRKEYHLENAARVCVVFIIEEVCFHGFERNLKMGLAMYHSVRAYFEAQLSPCTIHAIFNVILLLLLLLLLLDVHNAQKGYHGTLGGYMWTAAKLNFEMSLAN